MQQLTPNQSSNYKKERKIIKTQSPLSQRTHTVHLSVLQPIPMFKKIKRRMALKQNA